MVTSELDFENSPIQMDRDEHRFVSTLDLAKEINEYFGKSRVYITERIQECIDLAVSYGMIRKHVISSIIGGEIPKISVSSSVLKALAEKMIEAGFVNWNFGYWFDRSITNLNIFNVSNNNIRILCEKKDIPLDRLYKSPDFKPGFRFRFLSNNLGIEDINTINALFSNHDNPRFILGIGDCDESPIVMEKTDSRKRKKKEDKDMVLMTTGVAKQRKTKPALFEKDPGHYIENLVNPKLLEQEIKRSGYSISNLIDLCQMNGNDLNLYFMKSSDKSPRSIGRQSFVNLLYYLQSTDDFLTGKKQTVMIGRIPKFPKFPEGNPWILRRYAWKSLTDKRNKVKLEQLAKATQLPISFFRNAAEVQTFYVSERLKNVILKAVRQIFGDSLSENDLFIKDNKKVASIPAEESIVVPVHTYKTKVSPDEAKDLAILQEPIKLSDEALKIIEAAPVVSMDDLEKSCETKEDEQSYNFGRLSHMYTMLDSMSIDEVKKVLAYAEARVHFVEAQTVMDSFKKMEEGR